MTKHTTYSQIGGIKRSINLGREWRTAHPEIMQLARDRYTALQIVEELDLARIYDLTVKTATVAVYKCLRGHNGGFDIDAYDGALPKREGTSIARKNRSRNSKQNGLRAAKDKFGLFACTPKKMAEAGRKAGLAATLTKGETPWSDEELAALYRIATEPNSRHVQGQYGGKYNSKRIMLRLVDEGYPRRTRYSIQTKLYAHNRSLESKAS